MSGGDYTAGRGPGKLRTVSGDPLHSQMEQPPRAPRTPRCESLPTASWKLGG